MTVIRISLANLAHLLGLVIPVFLCDLHENLRMATEREPLSVTIITLNEERNLPRALASVGWADDIVIVDSGSTDRTIEIARAAGPQVQVFHNPWPGYGKQKNFAQDHAKHSWILNIDADEEVTPELRAEIEQRLQEAKAGRKLGGYFLPRKTFYLGRWIKHGGWYPNHLMRLADRRVARWTEPAVHEEWKVDGETAYFREPLLHYTFSDIQDQILTNLNFSRLGSVELKRRGQRGSLPRLLLKPIGKFIETYFLKLGCLDGVAGFIISVNAAHSMFLKYAYLIESDLERNP